jgi:hypothetical protein
MMMSDEGMVSSRVYIRADGVLIKPRNWLRLPPSHDSPYGSVGKFWGCYTNPNPRLGRMFRLTYWRVLRPDGSPTGSPDMLFSRLDSIDDHDWSDALERAWIIDRPSRPKKRRIGAVLAFPTVRASVAPA